MRNRTERQTHSDQMAQSSKRRALRRPDFHRWTQCGKHSVRADPTFEAVFGGARLDPSQPLLAAGSVSSLEDRLRGSKAQPFGPSDLGVRSGSKAQPYAKNPELRDGAPRFLGRETLEKPDSATSIAEPRTRMECLKRPTAKSVHFGSTNLPQKFCRRPNPKTLVHLAKAKIRGSASLRRPLVWYHSRNPREDFTNESARYRQD